MTEKELKKLSRADLLKLLISQSQQTAALQEELKETRKKLEDKTLAIEEAGSIAEAALKLNDVFASTENAAQQYLENIQLLSQRQEDICARKEAEAEQLLEETKRQCMEMERQEKKKAEAYWAGLSEKLEMFCANHKELRELLSETGGLRKRNGQET